MNQQHDKTGNAEYRAQLKLDLSLVFRRNNLQEHGVAPETIVSKGEKRLKGAFELSFLRQTQCRPSLKNIFASCSRPHIRLRQNRFFWSLLIRLCCAT